MLGFGLMAVGAILIVLAILLFFTGIVGAVMGAIGVAIRSMFDAVYHIFNKTRIDDNYVAYREARKKAELAEKLAMDMKEKTERENKEMDALTFSVNKRMSDLKEMYPLADKDLFAKYINVYTTKTVKEADDVANEIRRQHEQRMEENNGRVASDYNNEDLSKYDVMAVDVVDTMKTTVYVNGFTYIVETCEGDVCNVFTTENKQLALYLMKAMNKKRTTKRYFKESNVVDVEELTLEEMDEVVAEVMALVKK